MEIFMMQKKGLSSLFRPVELTQGECWKTILAFSFPIIVTAKDEKTITFDANHEMAGKELNFKIELVEVK